MKHRCVKCGKPFADARPLVPPVFCGPCLDGTWNRSVERERRRVAAWYDGPANAADVAPDQFNRAVGAPTLFEVDS